MPRSTTRRTAALLTATVASAAVATLGVCAPADARPIEKGKFHEPFSNEIQDYCGRPGLTVSNVGEIRGHFLLNERKPGTPPYGLEHVKATQVVTNADGDWIRIVSGALNKDLKITQHADGTATILILATGPFTAYDSSGKAIARDPGQIRFEILVDLNGTPTDPFDDVFLDFLGVVKGSTGRSDDFCAAALRVLG